jgi:hypothetical protein
MKSRRRKPPLNAHVSASINATAMLDAHSSPGVLRRERREKAITIPVGSQMEDVHRAIEGDPVIWNKYKKDRLTLADYVYDMAVNTKFMNAKVNPAVLDKECLGHPEFVGTGATVYYNDLIRSMRKAEKIVLEDDFVRQVVQVSTEPGGRVDLKQVRNALILARNPFSRTWIEWNARAMIEERFRLGSLPSGIADDAPARLGALCVSASDDGSVYYVNEYSQPTDGPACYPMMFQMGISTEEPIRIPRLRRDKKGIRFDLNSIQNRTTILLGNLGGGLNWEPLNQVSVDFDELFHTITFGELADAQVDYNVNESGGAIKFLVTALALINSAKIQYNVTSIPSGRRLSGGKSIPYMEHRTVKILVPAGKKDVTKYLSSVLKTEGTRKRAHKVRGFWRTLERGTLRERKAWVKPHVRGDASLGWVDQDHIVTT